MDTIHFSQSQTAVVVILSGNEETICKHLRSKTGAAQIRITAGSEKDISNARLMLTLLRSGKPDTVAFACKELTLQRYQFFLKTYLLLSRSRYRFLIDERGTVHEVLPAHFIFSDVPTLFVEVVASAVVVILSFFLLMSFRLLSKSSRRGNK